MALTRRFATLARVADWSRDGDAGSGCAELGPLMSETAKFVRRPMNQERVAP